MAAERMRNAAAIDAPALVPMPPPARVVRCGAVARASIRACGGVTRTLPGFEATPFRLAGKQLVWIGTTGPDHPRTVLIAAGSASHALALGEATEICMIESVETVGGCAFSIDDARTSACRAVLRLVDVSIPRGFASLLTGHCPPFPLSHRVDAVHALARACAGADAAALVEPARRLLGVGNGLTPSGDDFVGGALFALRLMHGGHGGHGAPGAHGAHRVYAPTWQHASEKIIAHAAIRTHALSATLLADLAQGQSYAALHDFAAAIARGDAESALNHASTLTSIGASSGWDMLAGFMAALRGSADPLHPAAATNARHPLSQPLSSHH